MKAPPPQSHNIRVQIPQHCEVAEMPPQFYDKKRAHMQQSFKQAELPDSMMTNSKIQSAFPLSMMSEREMLLLLYTRLGLN